MNDNMISVTQFSNYVKQIFNSEELLHNILIYGEVSGFNISRGTAYFNLKDAEAVLPCVRFNVEQLEYIPKDGDMVLVRGSPNYYTKGGRFSFVVSTIQVYGLGLLYQQFLELKAKLEQEGLFDKSRKKELPINIKRVGVVTSQTGAVIQDIIDITTRRNPLIDIVLYPAKVQGIGAEATIVQGITSLDKTDVDVIIVARGGGSLEDLSTFNTEMVARAIANANKPVISAVGHETDFTIADFVADLRAPTPSAAAELISIDLMALVDRLKNSARKILNQTKSYVNDCQEGVLDLTNEISKSFSYYIENRNQPIRENLLKLNHLTESNIKDKMQALQLIMGKIEAKNPMSILMTGYAITQKLDHRVRSIKDVNVGDEISTYLIDGEIISEIKKLKENEKWLLKNRLEDWKKFYR